LRGERGEERRRERGDRGEESRELRIQAWLDKINLTFRLEVTRATSPLKGHLL